MDKHVVNFCVKGRNVHPETIGMGELGELLKQLEVSIRSAVSPLELTNHSDSRVPLISLIDLHKGNSSDMGMSVLDYAIPAVSAMTKALAQKDFASLPPRTHAGLRNIYKWAANSHRVLEFQEDQALGIFKASISRAHPVPKPAEDEPCVEGQTTVWGYLEKAGGRKPKAFLHFPDGSKVIVNADEATTKELGGRLYEDVGIEGVATWRIRDRKLLAFKALRVLEYRPLSMDLVATFEAMRTASRGRWEGVYAAKYVDDLRGDD